jgi:hypothetical protein
MNACARALGIAFLAGSIGMAHAADAIAQGTPGCTHEQQAPTGNEGGADCPPQPSTEEANRPSDDTERVEMTVGSPPMQSDDTGTPGPGNWEINLGIYGDLTGGQRLVDLPSIDINYGYGDAVQFSYTLPVVFSDQAGPDGIARNADGWRLGESEAGIKYRFFDNKETGLSFAIYPQVRFRTPGVNKAVADGSTAFVLPMLATWDFAHASMTVNAGIEASAGKHFTFASIGIGTRLTDRVALLAEVVGENLNSTDERVVLFDIGIRRKISDKQSLSAALGRDLDVGGDRQEHAYFAIAYQMLFGQ